MLEIMGLKTSVYGQFYVTSLFNKGEQLQNIHRKHLREHLREYLVQISYAYFYAILWLDFKNVAFVNNNAIFTDFHAEF